MSEHGYELRMAFDSDEPEFARGFEAGMLYVGAEMGIFTGADRFSRTIHATNAEMALRVSEALKIPVRCEELDDDWLLVIFELGREGGE